MQQRTAWLQLECDVMDFTPKFRWVRQKKQEEKLWNSEGRNGGAERTAWEMLLETERIDDKASDMDQGAITLVLDSAEAFERVSLAVVWASATHFNFPRKMLRVLCGYFEHQRRVQFEGCVAEPLQTITDILLGSKWSCWLLRFVLQDASSEVVKVYPPLKLMVFVVDTTAFMEGRNIEMAGIAQKVPRAMRKDMRLSGREVYSKREGVGLPTSVETPGVDLRTRTQRPGAKEKARRKKCEVRFSIAWRNRVFQMNNVRIGVRKLLRMGVRQMAATGKKESVS